MSDPISDEELLEIQRRVEAATSGEWEADGNGVFIKGMSGCVATAHDPSAERDIAQACANARFIAHARTDVPKLLDALRQAYKLINKYTEGR